MNNSCCNSGSMIAEDLRRIVRLQKEAVRDELQEEFCSARRLGCGRLENFNTRPLQIFTDDDQPWACPINRNSDGCHNNEKTCVLRVEKVEGGAATFRALIPIDGETGEEGFEPFDNDICRRKRFIATDSFITIKLGCICAIRCMNDTFVDLCIRNVI